MSNPALAKMSKVTLACCLLSIPSQHANSSSDMSLGTVTDHRPGSKLQKNLLLGSSFVSVLTNSLNFTMRRGLSCHCQLTALAIAPAHSSLPSASPDPCCPKESVARWLDYLADLPQGGPGLFYFAGCQGAALDIWKPDLTQKLRPAAQLG